MFPYNSNGKIKVCPEVVDAGLTSTGLSRKIFNYLPYKLVVLRFLLFGVLNLDCEKCKKTNLFQEIAHFLNLSNVYK
ncbi:hypothetical protein BpHYR1_050526 [Brachionus plicatilis]|uniref:Uncharacterized protein n=1 Tax=Brachionus plicatilis TaxID=10195 RepID=A0A3M7Q306_BRAPC|nr:hypothetical protein BpHYR1_050526 [Brachionus plicatilis]